MSGIAGIARQGETELVIKMLGKISYRGHGVPHIVERQDITLGMVANSPDSIKQSSSFKDSVVWDGPRPPMPLVKQIRLARGAFSLAAGDQTGLLLARDTLGIRPLYYGHTSDGALCFASEVKALLEATRDVYEFPPGSWMETDHPPHSFNDLQTESPEDLPEDTMASHLRLLLEQAVLHRIDSPVMGSWLSGGLDSSAIAALARPHLDTLHTFSGGLAGAPDLEYARQMADYLHTEHHEVIVTVVDLLKVLPEVIYHMESFDALLIRSTLMNYLVAKDASQFVGSAFSGEGGDELFGGYEYLKDLLSQKLPDELLDITGRLHNTALQRVDRSASAHGLVIYVPLLDLDVVDFALRTPADLKIKRNGGLIEKYVFRLAMQGRLPDEILWRPKSKFWEGAGVEALLEQYAQDSVTDADFSRERILSNGWRLNTKEELMYYRIFQEHFGQFKDLTWMGRTKGAPVV
ncbi:MAG: asparagine synthase-related protein [Chloroflexota bacterium]